LKPDLAAIDDMSSAAISRPTWPGIIEDRPSDRGPLGWPRSLPASV